MAVGAVRAGTGRRLTGGRVLVLSEGDNPSLAYFIRPWLAGMGAECVLADSRQRPALAGERFDGVVILRYFPAAWHALVRGLREAGCPVAYFMDDDLMDAAAHHGLPLRYRWKLARRARWQRAAIESLCTEFHVSTSWLATKYAAWSPQVLQARADQATCPPVSAARPANVTACYHGTASHGAEQRWLVPVVGEWLSRCPQAQFEIIGGRDVERAFRGIERVQVLRPMAWPDYRERTAMQGCDIGLAPLLPGPFNAARAPTKYIDFARLGAVGIYADVVPYRGFVEDGIDGVLLGMDAARWVDALQALTEDAPRRQALATEARRRVLAQAAAGGSA